MILEEFRKNYEKIKEKLFSKMQEFGTVIDNSKLKDEFSDIDFTILVKEIPSKEEREKFYHDFAKIDTLFLGNIEDKVIIKDSIKFKRDDFEIWVDVAYISNKIFEVDDVIKWKYKSYFKNTKYWNSLNVVPNETFFLEKEEFLNKKFKTYLELAKISFLRKDMPQYFSLIHTLLSLILEKIALRRRVPKLRVKNLRENINEADYFQIEEIVSKPLSIAHLEKLKKLWEKMSSK